MVPMIRDLSLLLATDARTYSWYTLSVLTMQAEAQATKAYITLATIQYQWALRSLPAQAKQLSRPRKLRAAYSSR